MHSFTPGVKHAEDAGGDSVEKSPSAAGFGKHVARDSETFQTCLTLQVI